MDGFSLANHWQFAKFAKLSPHQTFPQYGIIAIYAHLLGHVCMLTLFTFVNCVYTYALWSRWILWTWRPKIVRDECSTTLPRFWEFIKVCKLHRACVYSCHLPLVSLCMRKEGKLKVPWHKLCTLTMGACMYLWHDIIKWIYWSAIII